MLKSADIIAAVRSHANCHYTRDGWDYVVECWSDADILVAARHASTLPGAIKAVGAVVKLLADSRAEANVLGGVDVCAECGGEPMVGRDCCAPCLDAIRREDAAYRASLTD